MGLESFKSAVENIGWTELDNGGTRLRQDDIWCVVHDDRAVWKDG